MLRLAMFNSIKGIITYKSSSILHLENSGIEWEIFVPDTNLEILPAVGEEAKIYTWLQHTQDILKLYGFANENERLLFFDLLKVDGIAARGACKIMSSITSESLMSILDAGDTARLEKISGIGKKTAAKMLLQLKGKLTINTQSSNYAPVLKWQDVVDSLVAMGYEKSKVLASIERVEQELLQTRDDFASLGQNAKEEAIFKKTLIELAR